MEIPPVWRSQLQPVTKCHDFTSFSFEPLFQFSPVCSCIGTSRQNSTYIDNRKPPLIIMNSFTYFLPPKYSDIRFHLTHLSMSVTHTHLTRRPGFDFRGHVTIYCAKSTSSPLPAAERSLLERRCKMHRMEDEVFAGSRYNRYSVISSNICLNSGVWNGTVRPSDRCL